MGIESLPGFQIGDGMAMAMDTHRDIDTLPETEREDT